MEKIQKQIAGLVCYALGRRLIDTEDALWAANSLLQALRQDALDEEAQTMILEYLARMDGQPDDEVLPAFPGILEGMCDYAAERGLIDGESVTERDIFDTMLMGILTERPSDVIAKFRDIYAEEGEEAATDWYYTFSQDTNYIRRNRTAKDQRWTTETEYGTLDISINLSKPEKDPRAIAAARNAPQHAYPKCQLCRENVGYGGRLTHPARQNHRIIPVSITGEDWYLQYSPYVYYNEHCIVFNGRHVPMKIDRGAFAKLFDFVRQFPHYFVGSNADLPIVGGSILSHEHFQGGHYEFAMERAAVETDVVFPGFEDVKAGIVRWPMSVIRISGPEPERLTELADRILLKWRAYTDKDAFIFAETDGTPHNTITPIARKRGTHYEMDLVLRNNITTEEHPLGVYHPHAELHHIKKENIGLIEVMGLAVLPARLKDELEGVREALVEGRDISADPVLGIHAPWAEEIRAKYPEITEENAQEIVRREVGVVFSKVLEDAGVFKRTAEGREAFMRFVQSV